MYSVRCREDYSIFEKVWNEMEDEQDKYTMDPG